MTNRPYCSDVVEEINKKMFARNIASGNLDTLLDPRAQPTKYVLPFVNNKSSCRSQTLYYKNPTDFNPGTRLGSWSGFASNINDESILRNQIYANHKYPQGTFVPDSTSDLYNSSVPKSIGAVEAQFPNLFNGNIIPQNPENLGALHKSATPSYLQNLGNNLFNNATRQQLKDS